MELINHLYSKIMIYTQTTTGIRKIVVQNDNLKETIKNYISDNKEIKGVLTVRSYNTRHKNLLEFLKFNNPKMDEIDSNFILNFTTFLTLEKKFCQNTINRHIKFVKQVLNYFEIKNPKFQPRKIKVEKDVATTPKPLSQNQVELIKNCLLPDHLTTARDFFVFQLETGFHYIDLTQLNRKNFFENRYIKKYRSKTNIEAILPLTGQALQIAEKYQYNFNRLQNSEYNFMLKSIAHIADINRHLVISDARDTFADYWGNIRGIALDDLAIMMGLANTKELKKYLRIREQRILNAKNLWA